MSASLLERVAGGDRTAVEACVRAYGGLVWSLAKRHLANESDVEDAVQDVFISLWKSAHRFDPDRAKEVTFVAMIARRRIIDLVRSRKPSETRSEAVDVAEVPAPKQALLADNYDAKRAARALATLPEDRQRVLWLSIHQGLSHREIADATGLPIGTVKSHVRRGLQAVRDMLCAPPNEASEPTREVAP